MNSLTGKTFICFGDSITSAEVTGVGNKIAEFGGMKLLGNFAHGNASASDWHDGEKILTKRSLEPPMDRWFPDNALSNQVYTCLERLGQSGEKPEIIYIAISVNDGKLEDMGDLTPVSDDCEAVFSRKYEELTRVGIASALRWAIETLQAAFPRADIFAASPLQTNTEYEPPAFAPEVVELKRQIVRKVCGFCGIYYIDSYAESGFTREIANIHGDGVHPDPEYRDKIASFVAEKVASILKR